jgi:hypothetical protein
MPKQKKPKSPIDDVFDNSCNRGNKYSYRRRNGNESSSAAAAAAVPTGNYIVTKTKYQRVGTNLPPPKQQRHPNHHQYHRSQHQHNQQQQQQNRHHAVGRPKESTSPRKQLCTVARRRVQNSNNNNNNYGRYDEYNGHNKRRQQQQQKLYQSKYSYPISSKSSSSSSSSAVNSKFYEMKLPDLKRIREKEKENNAFPFAVVTPFPCWMKGGNTSNSTVNDSSMKKLLLPTQNSGGGGGGGGGGKSIQDIIRHIRGGTFGNDAACVSNSSNDYDVEMNLLTQYIQLSSHEVQLRNHFVSQLEEQIIQQIPSIGLHSNNKTQYCHVFGSFASIQICTFQSDLDIALFNVGIEGNYRMTTTTTTTATTDGTTARTIIASTDTTATITSSSTEITTAVSDDQFNDNNHNAIASNEVIIIDDDEVDETTASAKMPLTDDSKTSANTTKQQRRAMLVAKWKLALEECTATTSEAATTTTVGNTVTNSSSTFEDIRFGMDSENAIHIYNDSDFGTDSDENDSADPMNRFHQPSNDTAHNIEEDAADDDDYNEKEADTTFNFNDKRGRKRAYSDSTILSMDSQNGASSPVEERSDGMTVSFFASKPPPTSATTIGPQGHVRIKVVSLLATLCNKLRKRSISRSMQIQNVTFIKTARVPIIKIQLLSGFNVDIAVGGYGTDTSLYAAQQMELYPNLFVPVVVLLKVLLAQHNLDEPYTGGLGSYKLYILIADHIYRHQQWCQDRQNGCDVSVDRMGAFEILLTFLYRYGYGGADMQDRQVWHYPTTALHQHRPLVSSIDGTTSADLSNVYKLQDCVTLFRLCFQRLYQQILFLQTQQSSTRSLSTLSHIICPFKLQSSRERILHLTRGYTSKSITVPSALSSISNTKNEETLRNKNDHHTTRSFSERPAMNNLPQQDRTRDEIIAGYEQVFS